VFVEFIDLVAKTVAREIARDGVTRCKHDKTFSVPLTLTLLDVVLLCCAVMDIVTYNTAKGARLRVFAVG
jgi:hypothetical protein